LAITMPEFNRPRLAIPFPPFPNSSPPCAHSYSLACPFLFLEKDSRRLDSTDVRLGPVFSYLDSRKLFAAISVLCLWLAAFSAPFFHRFGSATSTRRWLHDRKFSFFLLPVFFSSSPVNSMRHIVRPLPPASSTSSSNIFSCHDLVPSFSSGRFLL